MPTKKKILITEDEKPLARALTLKLKDAGFEVDNAYDGAQALEALGKKKYDLILLDLIMPKMDGFSVLEAMKQKGDTTTTIVTTNLGQDEDHARAKMFGAKGYIVKADVSIGEIIADIKRLLGM